MASFTGFRNMCSSCISEPLPLYLVGTVAMAVHPSSHDAQMRLLLKETGHLLLLGSLSYGTVKCIQIRFCGRAFFTAVLLGWVTATVVFFGFPLTAYTSVSPALPAFWRLGFFCLIWEPGFFCDVGIIYIYIYLNMSYKTKLFLFLVYSSMNLA